MDQRIERIERLWLADDGQRRCDYEAEPHGEGQVHKNAVDADEG